MQVSFLKLRIHPVGKIEVEVEDYGKQNQGIDAQSDDGEFEFVDDQKNDTKLNISQEEDNRN